MLQRWLTWNQRMYSELFFITIIILTLVIPKFIAKTWIHGCNFYNFSTLWYHRHFDGLMHERHNSSANALELCFSCINPFHLISFLIEEKDLPFWHNQYIGCWWPGDTRSQGTRMIHFDEKWLILWNPSVMTWINTCTYYFELTKRCRISHHHGRPMTCLLREFWRKLTMLLWKPTVLADINRSMGWCKKDITPLLMHWSYIFHALIHWDEHITSSFDILLAWPRVTQSPF